MERGREREARVTFGVYSAFSTLCITYNNNKLLEQGNSKAILDLHANIKRDRKTTANMESSDSGWQEQSRRRKRQGGRRWGGGANSSGMG